MSKDSAADLVQYEASYQRLLEMKILRSDLP